MLHITYPLYQTCSSALLCSLSTPLSLSWFQPHFPFHHPQTPTNSNRSLSFYLYIWCILKTIKNEESKMNLPFFVVENSWILPKFQLNFLVLIVQLQRTRPCWPGVAGSSWRRRRRENLIWSESGFVTPFRSPVNNTPEVCRNEDSKQRAGQWSSD